MSSVKGSLLLLGVVILTACGSGESKNPVSGDIKPQISLQNELSVQNSSQKTGDSNQSIVDSPSQNFVQSVSITHDAWLSPVPDFNYDYAVVEVTGFDIFGIYGLDIYTYSIDNFNFLNPEESFSSLIPRTFWHETLDPSHEILSPWGIADYRIEYYDGENLEYKFRLYANNIHCTFAEVVYRIELLGEGGVVRATAYDIFQFHHKLAYQNLSYKNFCWAPYLNSPDFDPEDWFPCGLYNSDEISLEVSSVEQILYPASGWNLAFNLEWPDVPGPDVPSEYYPDGWPGVEVLYEEENPAVPWIYSATYGGYSSSLCEYQGLPGVLNCQFDDLPQNIIENPQDFELFVDKCNSPRFTKQAVNIPFPSSESSSGDSATEYSSSSSLDSCSFLDELDLTVTMLSIAPGSTIQTVYITVPGGVPGYEKAMSEYTGDWKFSATLGSAVAEICSFEGYPERLYCTFNLSRTAFDTTQPLTVMANHCSEPFFVHPDVSIFTPPPACTAELEESDCVAAGGQFLHVSDTQNICDCP